MHNGGWWIWIVLIVVFAIFQSVRGALRGAQKANSGIARLNAAAERILKERGATAANPIPRTKPTRSHAAKGPPKPRHSPAVMKAGATPAVIRRGGLLSGGREPVIQRRR